MDLFDVLSMGERVIVFSSVEDRIFYTWNHSATLQCWEQTVQARECQESRWEECGIKTLSVEPRNFEEAVKAACNWYFGDTGEVVIDHLAKIKDTVRMFGMSKKRAKKIKKMVKRIAKDNKKRGK